MIELWLKQAFNLSLYQSLFLLTLVLLLLFLFASIDYADRMEDD